MRTINDFNREYRYKNWSDQVGIKSRSRKDAIIKNAIFYLVLVIMVIAAFLYSGNSEFGKRIGPFAYNTVLTTSMNSVYSRGSLIASWAVKPGEPLETGLKNGTDIVFTKEDGKVVVHRIIEIIEDYEDGGQRAFRTQGVDNPAPDKWITYEGNVIGRVIWHVPYVGGVLALIAENMVLAVIAIIAIFTVIALVKFAVKKETIE